jgi:TatD DNase family protein
MIIDTHCHLHDPAFADVRETARMSMTQGVYGIVAVGCDAASNELTLTAGATLPKMIYPCVGFHPDRPELGEAELDKVEEQVHANQARLAAIGEVGLPWYSLEGASDPATLMTRGRASLDRMLALAAQYDLAVVLHAPHGAAVGALEALERHGIERAVFHWHKAPAEITRAIVAAGYFVSVTPEVVYRERDRDLVERVPLESLLVESDAPWQYGGEFTALPSGPWLVARAAEEVAKLKHRPIDEAMSQLCANACRLFDIDSR